MYTRIIYGKYNSFLNYSEFICDFVQDLDNLPTNQKKGISNGIEFEVCSIGSIARVIEDKNDYILNTNGEWEKYGNRSSPFPTGDFNVTDDGEGNVVISQ